jgi:hypothetical protein
LILAASCIVVCNRSSPELYAMRRKRGRKKQHRTALLDRAADFGT